MMLPIPLNATSTIPLPFVSLFHAPLIEFIAQSVSTHIPFSDLPTDLPISEKNHFILDHTIFITSTATLKSSTNLLTASAIPQKLFLYARYNHHTTATAIAIGHSIEVSATVVTHAAADVATHAAVNDNHIVNIAALTNGTIAPNAVNAHTIPITAVVPIIIAFASLGFSSAKFDIAVLAVYKTSDNAVIAGINASPILTLALSKAADSFAVFSPNDSVASPDSASCALPSDNTLLIRACFFSASVSCDTVLPICLA